MKNSNKKQDKEKGLKLFMIGFLITGAGFLIGYFDFDSTANIIIWVGFFVAAFGLIINMSIILENRNKR